MSSPRLFWNDRPQRCCPLVCCYVVIRQTAEGSDRAGTVGQARGWMAGRRSRLLPGGVGLG